MRNLAKNLLYGFCLPKRIMIQPEPFTTQNVQDYCLIKSSTYQFLIKPQKLQKEHIIYKHQVDTPSNVLKKAGLHIFPKQIPQTNRRQKYNAVYRKMQQEYQKSFENCKTPAQIFHMNRRIKTQLLRRLQSIGAIQGRYKHYLVFKSYKDIISQRTKQQYEKKGVKIQCMGGLNIFPKGQVWMPTNQKYLVDLISFINKNQSNQNIKTILDIGSGSGILSFLCAKTFKNANIYGFDINPAAVDTYNINASSYNLQNAHAFLFDVTKLKQFKQKIKEQKIPQNYDLILINPPWIQAKKANALSFLQDGVYDYKGRFLQNSIKLAKNHLKDKNSRVLLIYSTLSKQLSIQTQSVQNLCKVNNLLIHQLHERPLTYNLQKPSPLNQFKNKSLIQLFEIGMA